MMNERRVEVKARLEKMLAEVRRFTGTMPGELLNIGENQAKIFKDDLGHAQDERILDSRIAVNDQQRVLEGRITTALRKLKLGTFGKCDRCEEAIDAKRLAVQPFANYCMHCQTLAEYRGEFSPPVRQAAMVF